MRDFGNNVFEGTAKYYFKHSSTYPKQLFNDIAKEFDLNGQGWLLDLGCETGETPTSLDNFLKMSWLLDPGPELLKLGREKTRI